MNQATQTKKHAAWVRVGVDYLAPIVFVATILTTKDFQLATWVLVAGSALALAVGWIVERRLAPLPLLAGGAAVVFGSLTLIFNDSSFVKMKPTVVNTALAIALLIALKFNKLPLKSLLGETFKLPDAAWRTLTLRYSLFFLACAAANEAVWRTQSDSTWGLFRLSLLGFALLFSLTQTPFLMKHMQTQDSETTPTPPDPGF